MALPPESLTLRQAVFLALELLKGASPLTARHYDDRPNVLATWELALCAFSPATIRAGAIRMVQSQIDGIADTHRLASHCAAVDRERRVAEAQARRIADDEADRERIRRDREGRTPEELAELEAQRAAFIASFCGRANL